MEDLRTLSTVPGGAKPTQTIVGGVTIKIKSIVGDKVTLSIEGPDGLPITRRPAPQQVLEPAIR